MEKPRIAWLLHQPLVLYQRIELYQSNQEEKIVKVSLHITQNLRLSFVEGLMT